MTTFDTLWYGGNTDNDDEGEYSSVFAHCKGNLPQGSLFEAQGTDSCGTIRTPSVLKSIRPCCASPRILRFASFCTR